MNPAASNYLHALHEIFAYEGKKPFFVEIGAMDGVKFDELHPFVSHYQWPGLLVEPVPDQFETLKSNYANHDNLIFENSAVTEQDGDFEIERIPPDKIAEHDLPIWALGISSMSGRNAIAGHGGILFGREMPDRALAKKFQQFKVKEKIRGLTFESLMNKHDISRIDILQIDAEGYDYKIFKQIDFDEFRPYFMRIEVLNLMRSEYDDMLASLSALGYSMISNRNDVELVVARRMTLQPAP